MSLSAKDIRHIADLAKLKLTDKEVVQYRREISGIVRYIDRLAEVNVTREQATLRVSDLDHPLREDLAMDWAEDEKSTAIKAAPKNKNKFICVPRIFES